jgi:hypothetical protein
MSAVAPPHAAARRRRPPVALLVLAAVAGLLGALLGRSLAGEPSASPSAATRLAAAASPAHTVAAGDLRFALPDRWTPAASGPVVPGFDRARPAYASSWSARAAIALLRPANPTLLPPALAAARGPGSPPPLIVQAGAVRAYHYVVVLPGDRVLDVYAAPTTQGTATVACSVILYTPAECDPAVGALRLARGAFLPLSPNAAFLEALPGVVDRLNARRGPLRERLIRARTSPGGARTSARLGAAYAAAGRALRPLVPGAGEARTTARTLARLATAHAALARALKRRDHPAFSRAALDIRAGESRLGRALAHWQGVLRSAAAG